MYLRPCLLLHCGKHAFEVFRGDRATVVAAGSSTIIDVVWSCCTPRFSKLCDGASILVHECCEGAIIPGHELKQPNYGGPTKLFL